MILDEDIIECGCIEEDKAVEQLRQEPYTLPQGFVWDTLDISDAKVVCNTKHALVYDFDIFTVMNFSSHITSSKEETVF